MRLFRYGMAFVLVLHWNIVLCSELMVDDEFVMMDGIKVRKDSIRNETGDFNKSNKKNRQRETAESDDIIEDQDDDDDDDEEDIDNDEDEDLESTKHLPTKCHGKLRYF